MTNYVVTNRLKLDSGQHDPRTKDRNNEWDIASHETLPALITKASSRQTYYTIRLLADRDRIQDAYRAYAYFRWLDDRLDETLTNQAERMVFVERQQMLINSGYRHELPHVESVEERLLLDLIQSDQEPASGLQAYIRNMMAVMAFDASRRGRLISQQELADYTQHLSVAVTEALHYFIGHDDSAPQGDARYHAVTAAHITHMLRDTMEDVAAGYFNIPREYLEAQQIDPRDVASDAYRKWVESQVRLARTLLAAGKAYTAQVSNLRCRLAGYAYIARFEWVLDTIEREGYQVRPSYPERKSLRAGLGMGWSLLSMMFEPLMGRLS